MADQLARGATIYHVFVLLRRLVDGRAPTEPALLKAHLRALTALVAGDRERAFFFCH